MRAGKLKAIKQADDTLESPGGAPPVPMLIEIGWMIVGGLDAADDLAVRQARDSLLAYLRDTLPDFNWNMPMLRREALAQQLREEPVRLFELGTTERELRRWDFAILVTPADLVSHARDSALAVSSTALGLVAISTARIDPHVHGSRPSEQRRAEVMAHRIEGLVLHSFGHLIGLEHSDATDNCMYNFQSMADIDACRGLHESQLEPSLHQLREIADSRLEEEPAMQGASRTGFYARAMWRNRRDILKATWRAAPWLFPVRLSRLATAALSALLILIMTAESWELGMSLPLYKSLPLAAFSLFATTAYVIKRQRLLVRRYQPGTQEHRVVAVMSTLLVVLLGMGMTLLLLMLLTLALGAIFVDPRVVQSWAASNGSVAWPQHLSLAAFVGSVGLVIGALGASFEDQLYFRHVTYVDEEI